MLSHPQPLSEFRRPVPLHPLPHPPHRHSKMMIQVMVLHPHPELEDVLDVHPHPVAVKSLMVLPPKECVVLCYILCRQACMCFSERKKIYKKNLCGNSGSIH